MKRTILAWILTILWLAFWGCYFFASDTEGPLKANEVGDFLAGVTAPVAFFWLILGYFQQGEELRQNTEALKLQEYALKQQVEETRELVRITAEQAAATIGAHHFNQQMQVRQAQPHFVATGGSHGTAGSKLTVSNLGATITKVRTVPEGAFKLRPVVSESWGSGEGRVFEISPDDYSTDGEIGRIRLFYRDSIGNSQATFFVLTNVGRSLAIGIPVNQEFNADPDVDHYQAFRESQDLESKK